MSSSLDTKPVRPNRSRAIATLVATLAGLAIAAVPLAMTMNSPNSAIVLALWAMLASVLVPAQLGEIYASTIADAEHARILDLIGKIPQNIGDWKELEILPTNDDGVTRCLRLINTATNVKNMVVRYGPTKHTKYFTSPLYLAWLDAKKRRLERDDDCQIEEIVSAYLAPNDDQRLAMKDNIEKGRRYAYRLIDDYQSEIVQMTLFNSNHGKEVVFGFEFPGLRQGHCFASRNQSLVDFFENYFTNIYGRLPEHAQWKDDVPALDLTGAISAVDAGSNGPRTWMGRTLQRLRRQFLKQN